MIGVNKYNLNLLFLGGDKRQEHIYKIFCKKFKNCNLTAADEKGLEWNLLNESEMLILPTIASTDDLTLNAPMIENKIKLKEIFRKSIASKAVITGKMSKDLSYECERYGKLCKQYTECESFKILNAIPTAEGAITLAINNTEKTIWGSNCLVIGNGCIGKALAKLLSSFGATVTVSARRAEDFAEIKSKKLYCIETKDIAYELDKYDVIFNTVPYRVIETDTLKTLNANQLIIDLASKPFGLDHTLASEFQCKIILGSSLPGIYSPRTAAEIAAVAIEQMIDEVIEIE